MLVALGIAVAVIASSTPAHAQDDLIDATPVSVTLDTPGPGHTTTWSMSVTNVSTVSVPLSLRITGDAVPLFSGDTPLQITVRDAAGNLVIPATSAFSLLDALLRLPALPAGSTYELEGAATLPPSADNSYQGLGGELLFRFVATDPRTPLAQTGGELTTLLVPVAAIAAAAGISLVILRRKARADA
ncbi:hypothetical protein DEU37_1498 [Microbacterium sp. AG790]|uniref:hypothetical protein n=1 Tax=Microbacterium sp. AG790 TaxID=2183995 RepID=UPI000EB1D690|nr:hypothetical protein [Microbacterium sp. AG790]RKS90178.1 hypothetical protein DEU37_1498 [Microbacterium sp. AG790]